MNRDQKERKTVTDGNNPILVVLYTNGVVEINSSGKSEFYFKEDLEKMEKDRSLIIEPFSPYTKDFGAIICARFFKDLTELKISDLK